jgi:hypothetical protein
MATVLGIHDYSVLNVYLVYSVQSSSDTERLSWNYRFQVPSLGDGNDDGIWLMHDSLPSGSSLGKGQLLVGNAYFCSSPLYPGFLIHLIIFFIFMIHFYLVDSGFMLVKAAAFWLGLYSVGWLL